MREVPFCGCTNEELERGLTCGSPQCPNREKVLIDVLRSVALSIDVYVARLKRGEVGLGSPLLVLNAIREDVRAVLEQVGEK